MRIALSLVLAVLAGCSTITFNVQSDMRFVDGSRNVPRRSLKTENGVVQVSEGPDADHTIRINSVRVQAVNSETVGHPSEAQLGFYISVANEHATNDAELQLERSSYAVNGKTYRLVSGATLIRDAQKIQPTVMIQNGSGADLLLVALDTGIVPFESKDWILKLGTLKLAFLVGDAPIVKAMSLELPETPIERIKYETTVALPITAHSIACAFTAVLYGGWCWFYLVMPLNEQKEEAIRRAKRSATEKFSAYEATNWYARKIRW